MANRIFKRIFSIALIGVLISGTWTPVSAYDHRETGNLSFERVENEKVTAVPEESIPEAVKEENQEENQYKDSDEVRVSIILEDKPALMTYSSENIGENRRAQNYCKRLEKNQEIIETEIEDSIDGNLDVVWNLTLAANLISANVDYGDIETIEEIPGVSDVIVETLYEPQVYETGGEEPADPEMASSTHMTGSNVAWQQGYTGSGMRIAIIDTGLDTDHQSVDAEALEYALKENAEDKGISYEKYLNEIQLESQKEVAEKLPMLNMSEKNPSVTAENLYLNMKVPFAYNYIDKDLDVTHDIDHDSDHGSHVAGISAANRYIRRDGKFVNASNTVGVVGNAPDAQLFVMKVFGKHGGAYDSDYMAAIEDAIVLGCDTVNLSLGSTSPGMTTNPWYQAILDHLSETDTVVSISAGNSGRWSSHTSHGKLYTDGGINFHTVTSPGSYKDAFTVASVNNDEEMGKGFEVAGNPVMYTESRYTNDVFSSLDTSSDQSGTEYPYVYLKGYGKEADYEGIDVKGKIVFCSRGAFAFDEKAEIAVKKGAIATVVYNNEPGILRMNLDGYSFTEPVISISQESAEMILKNSEEKKSAEGKVFYTGTMNINHKSSKELNVDNFYRMSLFSSWGVPSDLSMKPEISAPGGNIYSLRGSGKATDQYQIMSGTSMAAPQIAGVSALVKQAVEERKLSQKGITDRALVQSLVMSTAVPMKAEAGRYIPVLQQGAGIADAASATSAESFVMVDGQPDGKVKAELGDDPEKTGHYTFSFDLTNFTGKEQIYTLSADMFTQNTDGKYLDTKTTSLPTQFSWQAEGAVRGDSDADVSGYDFNGDKTVNEKDAEALLDYVNKVRKNISSAENADINHDGKVNTYDVHKLLASLDGETLTIPAKGSAKVTVTLDISKKDRDALNKAYPTGAYLEGYIFVKALSDAEGKIGTSHSIPVLGYYGNWTDASMFDNGTYPEYRGGAADKDPYMGNTQINYFQVVYKDIPYTSLCFGGNPVLNDNGYYPERNAINGEKGDRISAVSTSPIRNASAYRISVTNRTTEDILYDVSAVKQLRGAYYYGGLGGWTGSSRKTSIDWTPERMNEGDQIEFTYSLAPEYYVDRNKHVRWEDLGKGAEISVSATVDNTAPLLIDAVLKEDGIHVTAEDNRYIAGVMLYNRAGDKLLTSAISGKDAVEGEASEYVLDTKGLNGSKFLLQVADYARNITTYELNMELGNGTTQLPMILSYDNYNRYWAKYDNETSKGYMVGKYADSPLSFRAATMAEHHIFAATESGDLYAFSEDDFRTLHKVKNLGYSIKDMAYNPEDGQLYAVAENTLMRISKLNGDVTQIGKIGINTSTLACDKKGRFYSSEENGKAVYTYTLKNTESPELLVNIPLPSGSEGIQAMETDQDTGLLYFTGHYTEKSGDNTYSDVTPFAEIDPERKTCKVIGDLWQPLSAMIIQYDCEKSSWADPSEYATEVSMSDIKLDIEPGTSYKLTADVLPWTVPDRSVKWTSDNPSVADVSADGIVRGKTEGSCIIRAASVYSPEVKGLCAVRVRGKAPEGKLQAVSSEEPSVPLKTDTEESCKDGTVTLKLVADYPVTNGRINIEYDSNKVSYVTGTGLARVNSTGTADGNINFAYAYKSEAGENTVLGEFVFRPEKDNEAVFKVTVLEENNETPERTEKITLKAPAHKYKAEVTEPGCTTKGHTEYTCTSCGHSYRDKYTEPLGHDFGEWKVVKSPSNESEGLEERVCRRCGAKEQRKIPATDHDYEITVVKPTCTEEGYTLYTCRDCGHTYKTDIIPATGHKWSKWEVITPATDEKAGLEERVCENCGKKETREVEKHKHNYQKTVVKPTCTEEGYTTYTCKECGHSYKADVIPALGHSFGKWTVVRPATEDRNGLEKRTCTRCNLQQTREIPKIVHEYEKTVVKPTCESEGYTLYTCTKCGHKYKTDYVPALGHEFGKTTPWIKATCTKDGLGIHKCERCGLEEFVVISARGHQYTEEVVKPSCGHKGYTLRTCSVCGKQCMTNETAPLEHEFGEWEVKEAASCKNEGYKLHTCKNCGKTEGVVIPKEPHQYKDIVVPPDYDSKGYTKHVCEVCGHVRIDTFTEPLEHKWAQWR